nr:XP [Reverse genetics vector pMLB1]
MPVKVLQLTSTMQNGSLASPITSELDLLGQILHQHPNLGNVGLFLIGIAVVGKILVQLGLNLRCRRQLQQHSAPLDQI